MSGCTIPNDRQMEAVRRAAAASEPRTHALIALAANTGLRAGTLARLRWGHVFHGTAVKPLLRVEPALLKGGTGAYRRTVRTVELPLNQEARLALERLARERLAQGPVHMRAPLFPSQKGGAISRWQVNYLVQGVFARAGLAGCGAWGVHSLRKHFGRSLFKAAGSNMRIPQAALGHSRASITEIYIPVEMDDVAEAVLAIGRRSAVSALTQRTLEEQVPIVESGFTNSPNEGSVRSAEVFGQSGVNGGMVELQSGDLLA